MADREALMGSMKFYRQNSHRPVLNMAGALIVCLLIFTACNVEMNDQKKYEPLEPSTFFNDGKSSRELVPNTVARGELRTDTLFYAGMENDKLTTMFPFTLTQAVFDRGRERYNVFC